MPRSGFTTWRGSSTPDHGHHLIPLTLDHRVGAGHLVLQPGVVDLIDDCRDGIGQ
jgi:hypothetical protein